MSVPPRIAFSTMAFPAATLAAAAEAGRRWGYSGVELRLTGPEPGPQLRRFLELASGWEAPLVRDLGGMGETLAPRDRGA
jgi:hypothetical protein